MGLISTKGHTAWRKFETDGVPGSGANEPDKVEIFDFVDEVDAEMATLQTAVAETNALILSLQQIGAGGMIGYSTLAAMNADLNHADGTLAQVAYTTDPYNAGTYRKSGAPGTGSWVYFPSVVDVLGPDIPKQIVVNMAASDGSGTGSPTAPYSINDAIAYIHADTQRRSLEIIFKNAGAGANHFRGPPMQFDVSKWREITIRAATGLNFDYMASRFIGAGSAAFTQPDAAGAPNVWMIDNKYQNISGNTAGVAQLIDIDSSAPCGRSGIYRSSQMLYGQLGNNVAASVMNSTAYRGGFSLQTTGPNIGKLFVHARGSLNPNTINFEQNIYDYNYIFYGSVGTDTHACRVNLCGLRGFYAGAAAIWADRCQVLWENCEALYCPGYGFQPNECWGELASCYAYGTGADGFNGNSTFPTVPDRHPRLRLESCKSIGIVQYPTPVTGAAVVGDGFSNHQYDNWELINCEAYGATKDGASMTNDFRAVNFIADDCATGGITFASQSGRSIQGTVFGGRLARNTYGIQCNGNGTVETARVDAYRTILDSNIAASLILTGNRPATINAYDLRTLGAVPSSGHKKTSDNTGTGSAINVLTSTALA